MIYHVTSSTDQESIRTCCDYIFRCQMWPERRGSYLIFLSIQHIFSRYFHQPLKGKKHMDGKIFNIWCANKVIFSLFLEMQINRNFQL